MHYSATTRRASIRNLAIGCAVALGFVLAAAGPSSALGTTNRDCTGDMQAIGYSSLKNGGFTTSAGYCGKHKARLFYILYTGSPTYYTGWVYSNSTAFVTNPGNIVRGGNHGVDNPALAYPEAKNFSS